jgi:hypothetical protein
MNGEANPRCKVTEDTASIGETDRQNFRLRIFLGNLSTP